MIKFIRVCVQIEYTNYQLMNDLELISGSRNELDGMHRKIFTLACLLIFLICDHEKGHFEYIG